MILLKQGPGILECDATEKGLLPRVVEEIFECTKFADETSKYTIKLSMVLVSRHYAIMLTPIIPYIADN